MIKKLRVILLSGVICFLGITSALAITYNEAPMLRTKVAAGELPPLEQRLPEEPLIVQPTEKVGQYGGTLHMASVHIDQFGDHTFFMWDAPLRYTLDGKTLTPELVKDWTLSADGKILTVYMRKGLKWSDGVPFTADDIMFWYRDMFLDEEITPVKDPMWCPGGKPMEVEKVDDYIFRFHFSVPYPIILLLMARQGEGNFIFPKHYLVKFHPRYVPMEELKRMAEEEDFDHWYQLFTNRSNNSSMWRGKWIPGYPSLRPWIFKKRELEYLIMERNPYYYKVDTVGNQLPYIDRFFITAVADREMYVAKTVSGEVDYAVNELQMRDLSLYKRYEEKGNYRTVLIPDLYAANVFFQLNQTIEDPVLRKVFQDVRFRRALSLVINREEINKIAYMGLSTPRQMTVIPESKYFEPEFATAYAQHNPEEANRLLDEMGLKWDEKHEYRLYPDGRRAGITLEYSETDTPKTPTVNLCKKYWKSIGIDVALRTMTRQLLWPRYMSNQVEMGLWEGDRGTDALFPLEPLWFVPMWRGCMATWDLWSLWYLSKGKEGEEPPEKAKRLIQAWEELRATMDEAKNIELGKEIMRSQADNLWTIGTVGIGVRPVVLRNNLRNFPAEEAIGYTWDYGWGRIYKPEQLFLEHPLLPSQK